MMAIFNKHTRRLWLPISIINSAYLCKKSHLKSIICITYAKQILQHHALRILLVIAAKVKKIGQTHQRHKSLTLYKWNSTPLSERAHNYAGKSQVAFKDENKGGGSLSVPLKAGFKHLQFLLIPPSLSWRATRTGRTGTERDQGRSGSD